MNRERKKVLFPVYVAAKYSMSQNECTERIFVSTTFRMVQSVSREREEARLCCFCSRVKLKFKAKRRGGFPGVPRE